MADMTAETDLLPLPDVKCWRAIKDRNGNVGYSDKPDPKYSESAGTDGLTWVRLNDHRAAMQAYARACVSSATAAQADEIEALQEEASGLHALLFAYASEFPATEDGDPDTGNIHANIRALKARAERLAEALREAYGQVRELCDCYGHVYPEASFARYEVLLHPTTAQEGNGDE